MRKPLAALSLAIAAGLGVSQAAGALAAPVSQGPLGTQSSQTSSHTPQASRPANSVSGAQIVQYALKFIGFPYTATGNSPATGFSCIGFASYVYRQNGIPLPGDLGDALAYAPEVPFSQIQPGDLLYFQNTVWNGLSHVAIYIGGGRFIHAEWYNRGVRISSFNNDPVDGNYWIGHYMTANRPWSGAAVSPVIGTPSGSAQSPTTTPVTQVATGPQALVTVSSLNVRARPSMKAGVREVVPQGTTVTIVGKRNGWVKVQLQDGTIGWVIAAGIGQGATPTSQSQVNPTVGSTVSPTVGNPSSPQRLSAPTATHHKTVASRVSGLRLHTAPSTGAPVVTSIGAGQRVQVLRRSNGWVKVRTTNGQVGWVMGSYLGGHATNPVSNTYSYGSVKTQTKTHTRFVGGSRLTAGVRVHTRPALKAPVVATAVAGTRVQILGRAGAWALVRLPSGAVGYVYGSYVR